MKNFEKISLNTICGFIKYNLCITLYNYINKISESYLTLYRLYHNENVGKYLWISLVGINKQIIKMFIDHKFIQWWNVDFGNMPMGNGQIYVHQIM